jgi:hypothetical protein
MARKRLRPLVPRRDKAGTSGPVAPTAQNKTKTGGFAARAALSDVLADRQSPASARVFAARTLAEMDGAIGRHQAPPSNLGATPLAQLSRDELVAELGRLRALIELGLVR